MVQDLLEVWRAHDEITQYLLRVIPDEGFQAVTLLKNGQPSKGRTVARVFAHMNNARRQFLTAEFTKGVPNFEPGTSPTRAELAEAFRLCGAAFEKRLAKLIETGQRVKDRPGIVVMSYLISHDSHHRGQILLALKQSAVRMPEEARYGIWEHWFRNKLTA